MEITDAQYLALMGAFVAMTISRMRSSGNQGSGKDTQYMQARKGASSDQMEQLKALAKEGHASSLASFTWRCLYMNQHQRAISLYEKTRHSLTQSAGGPDHLAWELANCDSNHALNLLGSGKQLEEVGQLWTRNESAGHAECRFYSTVYRIRCKGQSPNSIRNIPLAVRQDVRDSLKDGSTKAGGWYRQWCTDLLAEFGDQLG